MALVRVLYQRITVCVDVNRQSLSGVTILTCAPTEDATQSLHFTGGTVKHVLVNGQTVDHSALPTEALAARLANAAGGLELWHAITAGKDRSSVGELSFAVPVDFRSRSSGEVLTIEIAFETTGSRGPLRFATCGAAGPCAFTLQRPDGASPGLEGGASSIFPCVDLGSSRCPFDLDIRVVDADEDGVLRIPLEDDEGRGTGAVHHMVVLASGNSVTEGGKSEDIVVGPEGSRCRRWRFSVPFPVPAHAIGFVVAPLQEAASETVEIPVQGGVPGGVRRVSHAGTGGVSAASAGASSSSAGMGGVHSNQAHSRTVGVKDKKEKETQLVGVVHYCSAAKAAQCSAHAKRTHRMLKWFSETLGRPYPLTGHRHVFLPAQALGAHGGLQASCGLIPSACGASASIHPLHGLVDLDVYAMSGLTLYSDTLLTSGRLVDDDAAVHRAQALGIARSIFGCCVSHKGWADVWVTQGAASYVVDCYFRSFRGISDWETAWAGLVEEVACLEEEHPQLMPLCPVGALADPRVVAAALDQPLREHFVALKSRALWRMLAAQFGDDAVKSVLQEMLQGPKDSEECADIKEAWSTSALLALLKRITGSAVRSSPRIPLSDATDLFAHQWLYGRGVPQLHVGLHVNNEKNVVEVVIEQVLRVGNAALRPDLPPADGYVASSSREMASSLFLGPLTIHVVERPEATSEVQAVPDTWSHTVMVTRPRESFSLPCHSRVTHKPLESLNALPILRKRGRPRSERNAAVVEAAVNAVASGAARSGAGASHVDELNDTSVLRVRIDPGLAWLTRMHITAPPALLLNQLRHDPSPLAQMQAMASLCAFGLGSATYVPRGILPHPASSIDPFPVMDASVLPLGAQSALTYDVQAAATTTIDPLTALQRAGMLPRPYAMLTPVFRLAAVLLGFDHASLPLPKPVASNDAGKDEAEGGKGLGMQPVSTASLGGALHLRPIVGSSAALDTDWRVSCAAAFSLARWQTGHLPAYGRVHTVFHSWAGLGMLLACYQSLYYTTPDPHVAAAAAKDAGGRGSAAGRLKFLLESAGKWDEAVVSAIAIGGTPAPLSFHSLQDMRMRESLLCAIATVRHADGFTPDAVLAFLTRVLETCDNRLTASSMDDTPLVACLITSLGQALLASPGARRVREVRRKRGGGANGGAAASATAALASAATGIGQARATVGAPGSALSGGNEAWSLFWPEDEATSPDVNAFKCGWLALREQTALELTSMRYAALLLAADKGGHGSMRDATVTLSGTMGAASAVCPALDEVTSGRAAAAAIAAVTVLEASGSAPITLAPMLRAYVPRVHPVSQQAVPPCVRLAAVAGIARVLLAPGPSAHPQGTRGWANACAALVTAILHAGSVPVSASLEAVDDGPLVQAALMTLYEVQRRTDAVVAEAGTGRGVGGGDEEDEPTEDAGEDEEGNAADPVALARSESDLRRMCGLDAQHVSGPPSHPAPGFTVSWRLQDLAVDIGLQAISLHEKRLYGALRYAPSHEGILSPLARMSGREAPGAACVATILWQFATRGGEGASIAQAQAGVFNAARMLFHSVFGMAPPVPLRPEAGVVMQVDGARPPLLPSPFAILPASVPAHVNTAILANVHAFADARRHAIMAVRTSVRSLHATAELALMLVRDLPSSTGTVAAEGSGAVDEGEDGEAEDGEAEGEAAEGVVEGKAGGGTTSSAVATTAASVHVVDEEGDYEFSDDEEDKPKKRGRKPKHLRPAAAPAPPVSAGASSGALYRPSRAASAGVTQLMKTALEGAPPDKDEMDIKRGPKTGAGTAKAAHAHVFASGDDDDDDPRPVAKKPRPAPFSPLPSSSSPGHATAVVSALASSQVPAPTLKLKFGASKQTG